jgi:adenylate kinase
LSYIGTGVALREAVIQGTEVGLRAKSYLDAGQLAPDKIVNDLVAERLRGPDGPVNFDLDGYPRNSAQARTLDALLRDLNRPLNAVVLFLISDEVAIKRMIARHRSDDTEETARLRMRLFRDEARELVGHYRDQNLVHEINAGWPVEHVYAKIASLLLPRDA